MQYEEILSNVRHSGGPSRQSEAEGLLDAVLGVLGQRITQDEASDLAAQLPVPLRAPLLGHQADPERFGAAEFLRRVAEAQSMGHNEERLRAHVRAVFAVLVEAVSTGELADVLDQLPAEYEDLIPAAG
ncbi:DUF2267 domain-containing protein [Sciscionella sediminilitoris]|uniref:DUF2267 domain-containing protein n=1 Tax=Sciscionella sediminilitoris TaxID=1445613 RepID=UPI0004DED6B5|nr:DUF2267 domain-containing protein [Sciscionella sp. SE31]